jgi:hypothetical protein
MTRSNAAASASGVVGLDLNTRTVRASFSVAVRGRFENEDAREAATQVDGRISSDSDYLSVSSVLPEN